MEKEKINIAEESKKKEIGDGRIDGKKNNFVSGKPGRGGHERERYTHSYLREILETTRPVKVTKGGRRFSFTSLVLTQDKEKKAVACARGKGKEAMNAFQKAYRKTQKELIAHFSTPSRT